MTNEENELRVTDRRRVYLDDAGTERVNTETEQPNLKPAYVEDLEARTKTALITCEAATTGRTGVEMEAMTGAAIAALALYDMVKGVTKSVTISEIALSSKEGGKSGAWKRGRD